MTTQQVIEAIVRQQEQIAADVARLKALESARPSDIINSVLTDQNGDVLVDRSGNVLTEDI